MPASTRPLAALGLLCVVGAVISYWVFVHTHAGAHADEVVLAGRGAATVRGTGFAQSLLQTISVGTLSIAIVVLIAQALVRGRRVLAAVAAVVIVGPLITSELLKHVLLTRPDLVSSPLMQNSFPSGHTTIAFGIGIAATLVAPSALRNRVALMAIAYAGAIGIATVAAGWHRPSDVLGAYFVTMAWACLTVVTALYLDYRDFQRADDGEPSTLNWGRYVAIGAALLVVAYGVAIAVVFAGALGITDWTRVHGAFIAGCASLFAAVAVLIGAFVFALGRATTPAYPVGVTR